MKVEVGEQMVVEENVNRLQIEQADVEPGGEHAQEAENKLAEILLVCGMHDRLQEI